MEITINLEDVPKITEQNKDTIKDKIKEGVKKSLDLRTSMIKRISITKTTAEIVKGNTKLAKEIKEIFDPLISMIKPDIIKITKVMMELSKIKNKVGKKKERIFYTCLMVLREHKGYINLAKVHKKMRKSYYQCSHKTKTYSNRYIITKLIKEGFSLEEARAILKDQERMDKRG